MVAINTKRMPDILLGNRTKLIYRDAAENRRIFQRFICFDT